MPPATSILCFACWAVAFRAHCALCQATDTTRSDRSWRHLDQQAILGFEHEIQLFHYPVVTIASTSDPQYFILAVVAGGAIVSVIVIVGVSRNDGSALCSKNRLPPHHGPSLSSCSPKQKI